MFKNAVERIKLLLLKKTEGNNKKNIENLFVFLVILVITVIAVNIIWKDDKKEENENSSSTYKELVQNDNIKISSNNNDNDEYNLEKSLEDILSKISGVGKVQVLITYSQSSEIVAMYNEKNVTSNTEETDTNGGLRTIEQIDTNKEIIYEEKNGEKIPITQKVIMPKIEGAIVLAEGAENANIKASIIQAVAAVTGLSTYRIQVFKMST